MSGTKLQCGVDIIVDRREKGDASTQPTKWKPIIWNLKDDQGGPSSANNVGHLRGSSPSAQRPPSSSRLARSRSQSPRHVSDRSGGLTRRVQGEDLRRPAVRSVGRQEEQDHSRRAVGQDLRRPDPPRRQRYDGYSDRDPSVSRRTERFRSREVEQDGLEPDLRAHTGSRSRSDDGFGRVRRPVVTADKNILDLSYEEYLAMFGQVQDAWRKRKLEFSFINSQISYGQAL